MTFKIKATGFFIFIFSLLQFCGHSQVISPITPSDSTRVIQIVKADFFREKTIDSVTKLQILAGNVVVRDGTTTFSCDSAVINRLLNTVDAFGHVHINEADSIHTYANFLRYVGNERKAYLRKNVSLTDRKGKLTTNELVYDLSSGIGTYKNGGKIINKTTVLTSKEGTYLSDTKDVYFRRDVHLVDAKYDIRADSLHYNTFSEVVNFIGPTIIKSRDADIYTTSGYYDLKHGKAYFGNRPLITDSARRKYSADNIAIDEKTNVAQLEGNAVVIDSANGFTLTGGQIFLNSQNNSFLAMRKPVLIIQQKNDSTFIAADTLFSGIRERNEINSLPDTLRKVAKSKDTIKVSTAITDSTDVTIADSVFIKSDSTNNASSKNLLDKIAQDSLLAVDSTTATTTSKKGAAVKLKNKNTADSSVRYFLAFAHVRIFNDSLQAVCDSLSYSGEDSLFRMYKDPIAWSGQNQLSGDTIFMFTKNQKAERLYVFQNAMMINRIEKDRYNQLNGRTLNGYFINGNIDYMRSKGSPAESIYYVQDKDSAYVGMNRASGSVIDMYFVNKALKIVKFVNDVVGIMHPIRMIPEDQKYLKNFKWNDARRPKNKLELFE